jgi:hypothetical protein
MLFTMLQDHFYIANCHGKLELAKVVVNSD